MELELTEWVCCGFSWLIQWVMKIPSFLFALAWLLLTSCFDPFFLSPLLYLINFQNMECYHKVWSMMSKYDIFSCHEWHYKCRYQVTWRANDKASNVMSDITSVIDNDILKFVTNNPLKKWHILMTSQVTLKFFTSHTLKKVDISVTSYPSLTHCHLDMNCHSSCWVLFTCGSSDTTESGRPPRARFISEGIGVWFWRHQLHGVIFMTK